MDSLRKESLELLRAHSQESDIDRIDRLEEFLRERLPNATERELERQVLDTLWAERIAAEEDESQAQEQKYEPESIPVTQELPSKASKPIIVPVKSANPAPAQKLGGGQGRGRKKKQWVSLDSLATQLDAIEEPKINTKTPYEELQDAMGELRIGDAEIERFLTSSDFNLLNAVECMIAAQGLAPPKEEEFSGDSSKDSDKGEIYTREQLANRVVCRFFVRDGHCMRGSACMYSHDTAHRVCRFWLRGACALESKCLFGHEIPETVKRLLQDAQQRAAARPSITMPKIDHPELPDMFKHSQKKQLKPLNPLLRAPMRMPWRSQLKAHVEYTTLRDEARKISYLRNKYLEASKESFLVNNAGDAKSLSGKGRKFELRMIELHRQGAEILAAEASKPSSDNFIDLHGLNLEGSMDALRQCIRSAQMEGKANFRAIYCISGSGHYKHRSYPDALTLQIRKYLDDHKFANVQIEASEYGRVTAIDPFSGNLDI